MTEKRTQICQNCAVAVRRAHEANKPDAAGENVISTAAFVISLS